LYYIYYLPLLMSSLPQVFSSMHNCQTTAFYRCKEIHKILYYAFVTDGTGVYHSLMILLG